MTSMIIDQIQWQALADQARGFTYCVVDRTDQKIGTAIAIRLANRFFFATAGHVIAKDHDMQILPHGSVRTSASHFADRCSDERADVGFIELTPDVAHQFDFADATRLLTTIDTTTDLPTLVIGYPRQFFSSVETRLTDESSLRIVACNAFTYRSVLLPESQWPDNDSLVEPLVARRDLLVDFHPDGQITPLAPGVLLPEASPVNCETVDPHGLSGGGIWLANVEDRDGLWISDIRLIGLQTGWYEEKGWLRGVRIQTWLDMVRTRYADLAEAP